MRMKTVDNSAEYYRLREEQEREAAASAPSAGIAEIHLKLATKYRELAAKAEQQP